MAVRTQSGWRIAFGVAAAMLAGRAVAQDAPPRYVRPSVEELAIPDIVSTETADAGTREAMCLMIESAARSQDLPVEFFARVIWQESRFQSDAIGPVTRNGQRAQGIAQFMPGTASERRLLDPFDPVQALPKSAEFLNELRQQFGNLGLAAAAYNAGPGRVAQFVAGKADLPGETQDYVSIITRHSAEEWRTDGDKLTDDVVFPDASCVQIVGKFHVAEPTLFAHSSFWAPWGVQISGAFNKAAALRQYERASAQYAAILGGIQPMILGGRLRSRGFRPFYRVRAPAQSRQQAEAMCAKLEKVGGACVVLRSS
jgi:Transglycosylase SLT domain/SPOR domain